MKKQQSGFTLIELVMVIVILGILAASFAPKFLDVKSEAVASVQSGATGGAKSAHSIYIAKNKGAYPTVTQLAANVDGGTAAATGVEFDSDSDATDDWRVLTYTDDTCTTATTAVGDSVLCVGAGVSF